MAILKPIWVRLWGSIWAILGLNLERALGTILGYFRLKFRKGSSPHFGQFWGLNGRAPGLNLCNFGLKFGQGSGPQFRLFWGLNLSRALGFNFGFKRWARGEVGLGKARSRLRGGQGQGQKVCLS